jgi:hypothetical protein
VVAKARIGLLCEVSTAVMSWICNEAKLDRRDIPGAILQYFNKITQVRRKAKSDQLCLFCFLPSSPPKNRQKGRATNVLETFIHAEHQDNIDNQTPYFEDQKLCDRGLLVPSTSTTRSLEGFSPNQITITPHCPSP